MEREQNVSCISSCRSLGWCSVLLPEFAGGRSLAAAANVLTKLCCVFHWKPPSSGCWGMAGGAVCA